MSEQCIWWRSDVLWQMQALLRATEQMKAAQNQQLNSGIIIETKSAQNTTR